MRMPTLVVSKGLIIGFLLSVLHFTVFAQVKIGGFFETQKYPSLDKFPKIYTADLNQDNNEDILLYGNDSKKLATHIFDADTGFSAAKSKFFFYPVYNIKKLKKQKSETLHFFVSRSKRVGGVLTFTKWGNPHLLKLIEFDSFPENISVGNFNRDGEPDVLVSGSNFNGLDIVEKDNYRLKTSKLFERRIFSKALFFDLNQDNYDDIIAIDILNNSIAFFYNDQQNDFLEERNIEIASIPNDLLVKDYDNDGFDDLILSYDKNVSLFLGDSVYSFARKTDFQIEQGLSILEFEDYNGDSVTDFSGYHINNKNFGLYFGDGNNSFTEVEYISNQISSANKIKIGGREKFLLKAPRNIYCLGKTSTINNFTLDVPENIYLPDVKQKALETTYICYIDSVNYKLNMLINKGNNISEYHYSTYIPQNYDHVIIDEFSNNTLMLLYSADKHNGQLISIGSNEQSFTLNTNYPVIDGAIFRNLYEEETFALFTTLENDSLFFESFLISDEVEHQVEFIDDSVITARQNPLSNYDLNYIKNDFRGLFSISYDLANKTFVKNSLVIDNFTRENLYGSFAVKQDNRFYSLNIYDDNDSSFVISSDNKLQTDTIKSERFNVLIKSAPVKVFGIHDEINSLNLLKFADSLFTLNFGNLKKEKGYYNGIATEEFDDYFALKINSRWYIIYKTESQLKTMVLDEN